MNSELKEIPSWLQRAAQSICDGGVVIVPTETFYGIAADPFNAQAVEGIFRIKQRVGGKPLPLIASDRAVVSRLVDDPSPSARALMDNLWPGSLTILLRPTRPFSAHLSGPGGKIGVRVPPPCAAGTLAAEVGGWITATSANLSGGENPDEIDKIDGRLLDGVDFIVDLGPTPGGLPSTVVEPTEGGIRLIREGAIPRTVLEEFLN
jgi:L-threonylcarbamoyladenylate synthase